MKYLIHLLAAMMLCGAAQAQQTPQTSQTPATHATPPPRIDFASLPLQNAIKTVHGNGARQIAVFSDPDCPYCQRLERETLDQADNITIYTFLFPLNQHADAARKAWLIWCAADRAQAWQDWMRYRQLPPQEVCVPPLAANFKLGKKLGVAATPTLILPQGEMVLGVIDLATLEDKLKQAP